MADALGMIETRGFVGMVEAAASTFAHLGSELHDIDVPDPRALYESAMGLITVELALAHQDTFPSQADRYGKWARESIEAGLAAKPLDIGRGIIARDAFAAQLARVFGTVDAVLMPVFMKGTPSWAELRTLVDTDMLQDSEVHFADQCRALAVGDFPHRLHH